MKCRFVERVAFVVVQVALGMLLNLSIHFDLVSLPKIESTEGWNFGENAMGVRIVKFHEKNYLLPFRNGQFLS